MSKPINTLLLAISQVDNLTYEQYQFIYDKATAPRKERADRFLHREDSCRSLVGEMLLYYIVKNRLGKELSEVTVSLNEYGRPSIEGAPFSFSVSHSGSWAICAVGNDPCGADVERVHKVDLKIADRFFCLAEAALINRATDDDEKLDSFFTHWVLKESYIKAIGRGLNCPLNSFECVPTNMEHRWELKRHDAALPHLSLTTIPLPDSQYKCALCTGVERPVITPVFLTAASLIDQLRIL